MIALPTPDEIAGLPADGGPEFNRLVFETSPYLLQHARNPVDWYPWGEEARARARDEDLPIFLSVGYSTCHWCHVMERESFESESVAELLRSFVPIKVDREERPDLDELYMKATQLFTGQGGWPNSVWLTPDGRPWFAGTYFPPEDRGGRVGFRSLLTQLATFWRTRRDEVEAQADRMAAQIREWSTARAEDSDVRIGPELVQHALAELTQTFDPRHGGFGHAPKFPPHGSLRLLWHEVGRREGANEERRLAERTLDAMAAGGIRDWVGGGFHRYSTDSEWLVPHFEKMLYDNAQLVVSYLQGYEITGRDDYRTVAEETLDWVMREMADPEGGFWSALDADSEGEEGKFYVWTRAEVLNVLGVEDGELFCRVFGITEAGNFLDEATRVRTGKNIPHLPRPLAEVAEDEGTTVPELEAALRPMRARLLEARSRRVRPHTDDKVLVGWNGLMLGAFARAGRVLEDETYTRAAERAAAFVLALRDADGWLPTSWRQGKTSGRAFLDDYAYLADGLLELAAATGNKAHEERAREFLDHVLDHFENTDAGGFFSTSDAHERLIVRAQESFDQATPSGNGVAARLLVRLAQSTGEAHYAESARRTLERFGGVMQRIPRGTEALILSVAEADACGWFDSDSTGAGSGRDSALVNIANVAGDATARSEHARGTLYLDRLRVARGEIVRVAVRLDLEDGWHVVAAGEEATPGDATGPQLRLTDPGLSLASIEIDPPRPQTVAGAELRVHDGTTWLRAELAIPEDTELGARPLPFELRLEPCGVDRCHPPEILPLEVAVTVIDPAAAARGASAVRYPEIFS